MQMVITEHARCVFGNVVACDDITLSIGRGELFGLLGPNGAGKTTFVRMVSGLLRPTGGRIVVDGVDVVRRPDQVAGRIAYMPQSSEALFHLSVRQAVTACGILRKMPRREASAECDWLLGRLDMTLLADRRLAHLSGGQQQLGRLAMALCGLPKLLILDEPTSALDPLRRRQVWSLLRELHERRELTVILVTHHALEAERVIERVAIVRDGRVVALGTPGELKARVSGEIRIELTPRPGVHVDGERRARLAQVGTLGNENNGRIVLFVPRQDRATAIDRTLRIVPEGELDDFRVALPSLDDVYVALAGAREAEADA